MAEDPRDRLSGAVLELSALIDLLCRAADRGDCEASRMAWLLGRIRDDAEAASRQLDIWRPS